jgi:hypothetical protein
MSIWLYIILTLLFIGTCISGILLLIYSKRINEKMFMWSARQLKPFGNIPNPEGQREMSLWIIRIGSVLLFSVSVLFLYFLITDFFMDF